jgi:hypothetical protein
MTSRCRHNNSLEGLTSTSGCISMNVGPWFCTLSSSMELRTCSAACHSGHRA